MTDVSASSNNVIQMLLLNNDNMQRSRRRINQQRSRDDQSSSKLDISTAITGEYQPPPHVDFTELVLDSIDTHCDLLVQRLAKTLSFLL